MKKHIPLILALVAICLAGVIGYQWLLPAALTPVSPARNVILLLVPGLSAQSLQDKENAPVLTDLTQQCSAGLIRVTPEMRLGHACQSIADSVPDAITLLKNTHIRRVLAGADEAIPIAGSDSLVLPSERWSVPDPNAAEGTSTNEKRFTQAIIADGKRYAGEHTLFVAVYDDLYRTKLYTPLTLPSVSSAQSREALRRFDRLLALLTDTNGLPAGTALLVVSPVGAEEEKYAPVLLWRRDNASSGLLVSSNRGDRAKGVSLDTVLPTVLTLLHLPVSDATLAIRSGKS